MLLLWWIRRGTYRDRLPQRRVVVQFDFQGPRGGNYWLLMEPADVSVCLQHPNFDIDLLVTAQLAVFYQVWLGRMGFAEALKAGAIRLDGDPALARAFPKWFAWSPAAKAVRAARTAALRAGAAGT